MSRWHHAAKHVAAHSGCDILQAVTGLAQPGHPSAVCRPAAGHSTGHSWHASSWGARSSFGAQCASDRLRCAQHALRTHQHQAVELHDICQAGTSAGLRQPWVRAEVPTHDEPTSWRAPCRLQQAQQQLSAHQQQAAALHQECRDLRHELGVARQQQQEQQQLMLQHERQKGAASAESSQLQGELSRWAGAGQQGLMTAAKGSQVCQLHQVQLGARSLCPPPPYCNFQYLFSTCPHRYCHTIWVCRWGGVSGSL